MNKILRSKLNMFTVLCMVVLCTMLSCVRIYAVVPARGQAAYEIEECRVDVKISKAHKYVVTETIFANLTDDLTSLEFAIPNGNYKYSSFKIDGKDCFGVDKTVVIDNVDKLTQGKQTYTLNYTVEEYMDRDMKNDVLFFDILPPSWLQPITKLDISVEFPEDFPIGEVQYFAGQYGVQNVDTKLDFKTDETYKRISITGKRIPENFGITLKANLPNGYWQGALDGDWASYLMMIVSAVVLAFLAAMWFTGGRDPKPTKEEQTSPVEGVSAAEVGYVINGKLRMRDVIALIIYFATKGYLKITEYEAKKYRLTRLSDTSSIEEPKYIRNAYDVLFEDIPVDRTLDMDELTPRLYRMKKSMKLDVEAGFSSKEMSAYTPLSKMFRIIGSILLALSMGACVLFRSISIFSPINIAELIAVVLVACVSIVSLVTTFDQHYYSDEKSYNIRLAGLGAVYLALVIYIAVRTIILTGHVIPAIVSAIFMIPSAFMIIIMRARAEGNAALTDKLMQLKHFIYHPDAKQLLRLYLADYNYYYDIVPYAMIFNALETWAISFLTLNVPAPEWFSDEVEGQAYTNLLKGDVTVWDYAKDIRTFARTIEDSYHSMERQGSQKW